MFFIYHIYFTFWIGRVGRWVIRSPFLIFSAIPSPLPLGSFWKPTTQNQGIDQRVCPAPLRTSGAARSMETMPGALRGNFLQGSRSLPGNRDSHDWPIWPQWAHAFVCGRESQKETETETETEESDFRPFHIFLS